MRHRYISGSLVVPWRVRVDSCGGTFAHTEDGRCFHKRCGAKRWSLVKNGRSGPARYKEKTEHAAREEAPPAPAAELVARWSLREVDSEDEPLYDGMETDPNGDWVRWGDISYQPAAAELVEDPAAALKAVREALTEAAAALNDVAAGQHPHKSINGLRDAQDVWKVEALCRMALDALGGEGKP